MKMGHKRNKTAGPVGYRTAIRRMLIMSLFALKQLQVEDEFVDAFYKRLMYISDSVTKGYLSYEDMNRTLKAENGISVTGWE